MQNTRLTGRGGFRLPMLALAAIPLLFLFSACSGAEGEPDIIYTGPVVEYTQSPHTTPAPEATPRVLFREDLEFGLLRGQNNDIIGWVEVPGANIDYPVLKGLDNVFYLTHDAYKKEDPYGAVFADMINSFTLDDHVTVLYGHNSKRGDYFSTLHHYVDQEFFADEDNRIAYLYTPEKQMKFEIIAAFRTGNDNLLYQRDYNDRLTRLNFIDWMKNIEDENAQLALDKVSEDDRFLVLSTCTEVVGSDIRHLVIARLLEEV